MHGAELVDPEAATPVSDALLAEENRTGGDRLDDYRGEESGETEDRKSRHAAGDIEDAFPKRKGGGVGGGGAAPQVLVTLIAHMSEAEAGCLTLMRLAAWAVSISSSCVGRSGWG